jgi:hypothetical protein
MNSTLMLICWNGEVVRIAFALDCHDREMIGWVATTAGISGEMIRDLMICPLNLLSVLQCIERRTSWMQQRRWRDNG